MAKKVKRILLVAIIFSVTLLFSSIALAAPEAGKLSEEVLKWFSVAAGFGVAIAAFGGALSQGRIASSALEGIARNPGAKDKLFTPMILGLALVESLVIYVWVISLILIGKL